jgi:dipeptidyl aminopeptidase/acylaminoacyl peptidase
MQIPHASILLLAVAPLGAAQQSFTLADLSKIVNLSGAEASPDGKTVALVVSRANVGENRNESELHAVDVASASTRQLTFARHTVGQPHWSPDGRTLAFLAKDEKGEMQVWLLPMRGGEASKLTSSVTGVEHYAWRPDGAAIAYAAAEEAPKREEADKHVATLAIGAQDIYLREALQPQHIWLQTLDLAQAKRLTSGTWSLEFALPPSSPPSGLAWSPDGREIAFAQVPGVESGRLDEVHAAVLDVASGKVRALDEVERFQSNPSYSPDGNSIAYWYPRDGRADIGWVNEIYVAPRAGGAGRSVTRALDRNLYTAEWLPDSKSLLVAGNDATAVGLWRQPLDGAAERVELGDLVVSGAFGYEVEVASSGAVFVIATSASRPAELYALDGPRNGARAGPYGAPRRLTEFNAWADSIAWSPLERMTWQGPDGFAEDGVLALPRAREAGAKFPLVLVIHGGPTSSSKTNFAPLPQLMAAEGWAVFMPNYRGSDNLGNKYCAAIYGDAGAGPGRDVMAGVTELQKRADIDGTRKAVTGWSYGGYMTTWLLGNYPTEWRAGMAGAPVTDLRDQYNYSDGNVSWRYFLNGSPWQAETAEAFREQSPITYAHQITAPTLVMTNLEDFRVPPTQAFALYRALKEHNVECDFVGFPGRTHASSDPAHVRERTRLWIDWVKRHIDVPVKQ